MKARVNIENITGIQEFNLEADIIPRIGAANISFKNSISDFEPVITANFFDNHKTKIKHEIDSKNIYISLSSEKKEFEINIDLLSGKIVSMTCRKGYKGKLFKDYGIGNKMSELLNANKNIYFDLDHNFFVNYPFDGLIIYAPSYELAQEIFNATVEEKIIPDFIIEAIEIIDMEFAEKIYSGTLIY
ncbi:hypothetical protein [Flavobacterium solisilvae]|uniref:Uncharacterized protein n=1 Tax=Flavobacterium solisilvae TaxID=1852019 RepID=A0ABX1QUR5_9FLAO|nr:hypothetical protein [Flavobacterium solisilvae]NMH24687.1 hypothetical protein [Flavobacterium solisilvae]